MSSSTATFLGGLLLTFSSADVTTAFQQSSFTNPTATTTLTSTTSLNNMLRDYADYSSPRGPYSDSGSQSSNWRKNQGYTSTSTPRIFGGSYRDAETNPYYDPGWAQSTRRDNPASNFDSGSNYNGYDDPYNWRENRGYWSSSTYPGMDKYSYKTSKYYTNPTNPYYDPIWSQSYDRTDEPIREEEHMMYYGPGYYDGMRRSGRSMGELGESRMTGGIGQYGRRAGMVGRREEDLMWGDYEGGYRSGRGDQFGGYGKMNGPGRGLLAHSANSVGRVKKWMEARSPGYKAINGNSLMRIGRNSDSNSMSRNVNNLVLRMSYPIYDEFDGPWMPPPGMGGPGGMGGAYGMMEGRWGPDMRRRGRGGGGRGPRPGDGMMGGPSMGGRPMGPGPFGRDNAVGRMSLKDMAARTTTSYDAEVISSMNNREGNQRLGGATSNPTSTSSQFVPLSATYGPQATAERSPPLNVGAPPPPIIETRAERMDIPTPTSSAQTTVQTARSVRPSVVLVTSSGVRNENSQGSGFVVEFDDSEDDVDEMDRCYILTSAHVAPPGWKVSVTFPGDPDKQYPATVVGRKLNSDLALLSVESSVDDDDDEYPFPPPLTLSSDDISTSTTASSSSKSAEIGSPLYAFGYPMGLEGPTMTSGILSATTKGINYMDAPTGEEPSEISKSRPFEKTSFVITDAAMAGGMSGGPLVDYDGVVLGVNALVRPDLRALGNYAVSSIECESFLEKLEAQVATESSSSGKASTDDNSRSERRKKRKEAQRSSSSSDEDDTTSSSDGVPAEGVAGYRVMLYGYSTSKAEATTILKRTAGLDELRAENAMRSAYSFGAGVVDEFYVAESGDRKRAEKAARKKADDLLDKLKKEGMMVEVEPLTLLP